MDYSFEDGDFKVPHSNKTSNSDFKEWCPTYWDESKDSGGYLVAPCNLMFYSDWNWLIEVVDKCSLKADELNVDSLFRAELWMFVTNDITAVYNSCIDFIKWYNENSAE